MRKKWVTLLVLIALGLSITPIIILTRTYLIVHADQVPASSMGAPVLEIQTESSTCGVHALGTIYRAYGLDPEAERIRWRLGIDTKALMWMSDSTGALHPDLFMILAQDFFEVAAVDLSNTSESWERTLSHLETGHPALLLIRRRANGHLHWVVGVGAPNGKITLYDSLVDQPYPEGKDFLKTHAMSVILVNPSGRDRQSASSLTALLGGVREMKRAALRIESSR